MPQRRKGDEPPGPAITISTYLVISFIVGGVIYLVIQYFFLVVLILQLLLDYALSIFLYLLFQLETNTAFGIAACISLALFLFMLELRYNPFRDTFHRLGVFIKDQIHLHHLTRLRRTRYQGFRTSVKDGSLESDEFEDNAKLVIK